MKGIYILIYLLTASLPFAYEANISSTFDKESLKQKIHFDVELINIFKYKYQLINQVYYTVEKINLVPEQKEEELAAECQFTIQPSKDGLYFPYNSIRVWGSYKKSPGTSPTHAKITLRKGIGLKSTKKGSVKRIYENGLIVSIHANHDDLFAFLVAKMKNGQNIYPERVSDYGIGGSRQMVFSSIKSLPLSYIYYTWEKTAIEEIFVKLNPQDSSCNPH